MFIFGLIVGLIIGAAAVFVWLLHNSEGEKGFE